MTLEDSFVWDDKPAPRRARLSLSCGDFAGRCVTIKQEYPTVRGEQSYSVILDHPLQRHDVQGRPFTIRELVVFDYEIAAWI